MYNQNNFGYQQQQFQQQPQFQQQQQFQQQYQPQFQQQPQQHPLLNQNYAVGMVNNMLNNAIAQLANNPSHPVKMFHSTFYNPNANTAQQSFANAVDQAMKYISAAVSNNVQFTPEQIVMTACGVALGIQMDGFFSSNPQYLNGADQQSLQLILGYINTYRNAVGKPPFQMPVQQPQQQFQQPYAQPQYAQPQYANNANNGIWQVNQNGQVNTGTNSPMSVQRPFTPQYPRSQPAVTADGKINSQSNQTPPAQPTNPPRPHTSTEPQYVHKPREKAVELTGSIIPSANDKVPGKKRFVQYFKTLDAVFPHPFNVTIPPYNPVNQRLLLGLTEDGRIDFEFVGAYEVNEDNAKFFVNFRESARQSEHNSAIDKNAIIVNGVQFQPEDIYNEHMRAAIDELEAEKLVATGTKFTGLTDELKSRAIDRSIELANEAMKKARSARYNEKVELNKTPEQIRKEIDTIEVSETHQVQSIDDAVTDVIIKFGYDIEQDKKGGHLKAVRTRGQKTTLFKQCRSKEDRDTLLDWLKPFHTHAQDRSLDKLYASLKNPELPLEIYERYNAILTEATQQVMRAFHFDESKVVLFDDFAVVYDEFFNTYLVNCISKGEMSSLVVADMKSAIALSVAKLLKLNHDEIKNAFPTMKVEQTFFLEEVALFETKPYRLTYLPVLAAELLLTEDVQSIPRNQSALLNGLFKSGQKYKYDDYLVTEDRKVFRIIYGADYDLTFIRVTTM